MKVNSFHVKAVTKHVLLCALLIFPEILVVFLLLLYFALPTVYQGIKNKYDNPNPKYEQSYATVCLHQKKKTILEGAVCCI